MKVHNNSRYTMGCRCDICTKAAREYRRSYVAKNRDAVNALKRKLYQQNRKSEAKKKRIRWKKTKDSINAARRAKYKRDPVYRQKIIERAAKQPREGASDKVAHWRRHNPEKYRSQVFKRRTRKKQAKGFASGQAIRWRKEFYGHRCWICGAHATTIDHVIPLARDGTNWPANLRPACLPCNARKHAKILPLGNAK